MEGKEVKPLREVLGERQGLVVRVYCNPTSQPVTLGRTARVIDEYMHGTTTGKFHGKRPVLNPCPPVGPMQRIDYYLSESDVRFRRKPTAEQRVRRGITWLPSDRQIEVEEVQAGHLGGRPKGFSDQQKADLTAQMHQDGKSNQQIAAELGISNTSVYRYLKHFGHRRKRGRPAQNLRSER